MPHKEEPGTRSVIPAPASAGPIQRPEQGQGRPELQPDRGGVVTLPERPDDHHEDTDEHQRRGEDPASSVPRDFAIAAMHPAGRVSRRSIVAPPQPVVKVMIGVIGHPTDYFLAADRFQVIRRQGMRSTTAMRPSAPLGRTQIGGRKRCSDALCRIATRWDR
jgi:hypothetical protein